jgi:hypothetical protein
LVYFIEGEPIPVIVPTKIPEKKTPTKLKTKLLE